MIHAKGTRSGVAGLAATLLAVGCAASGAGGTAGNDPGTGGSGGAGAQSGGGGSTGTPWPGGAGGTSGKDGGAAGNGGTDSGAGGTSCKGLWSTDISPASAEDVLLDGNTLYAFGEDGSEGWVASFSTCDGTKLAETKIPPPQGQPQAGFQGGVIASGALYVAGDTLQPGAASSVALLARFAPTGLAVASGYPKTLGATTGADEIFSIAFASSGGLWLAGSTDSQNQTWGIKASQSGAMCGFSVGVSPGSSHAVHAEGSSVYFVDRESNKLVLRRFSDAACSSTSPCSCTPAWSSQPIAIKDGSGTTAHDTTGYGISIVSGVAYVGGMAHATTDSNSAYGFVVGISLATGTEVGAPYTYDPSSLMDGFIAQSDDGADLYVAGGSSFSPGTSPGAAQVLVVSAATPPVKLRSLKLTLAGFATGVAAEPGGGDGVYVSVNALGTVGAHRIVRCHKDGTCP